jgi:hypothetical protein
MVGMWLHIQLCKQGRQVWGQKKPKLCCAYSDLAGLLGMVVQVDSGRLWGNTYEVMVGMELHVQSCKQGQWVKTDN